MSDQDTVTPEVNENSFLNTLVGEGKKYNSVEDLAKGYVNADDFISTLKTEKQEVEDRLNSVQSQEDQLNNIVKLLKPEDKSVVEETQVEPIKEIEPTAPAQKLPDMDSEFNAQEFARLAVEKYGNATTAGNKLSEFINSDPKKHEAVMAFMQTDPSALVRMLPDAEVTKEMNPTGSSAMTGAQSTTLPVTYTEAMKVLTEDKKLYRSTAYQTKLKQAMHMAKQAGINFENT